MKYEKSILDACDLEIFISSQKKRALCGETCFGVRIWHKKVYRLTCSPARFLCVSPPLLLQVQPVLEKGRCLGYLKHSILRCHPRFLDNEHFSSSLCTPLHQVCGT